MKTYTHVTAVVIALLGLLFFTDIAFSQTSESVIDTSKVYELDEVIISASRYVENPSSVGRNVTVLSGRDLQQSMYSDIGELLQGVQNVHMAGTSQTPGSLQSLYLRNTNSNHSVILIDGVRISDPSSVDNSIDLTELSLAGVERIEIVRGSHSSLYGSSAIGGVINLITKNSGQSGLNGTFQTSHGSLGGESYRTKNILSSNYTFDNGLYFNVGIAQEFTEGIDATIDTTVSSEFNPQDKDGFEKLDLNGKIGFESEKFDIWGSYRRENQKSELDQGSFDDDDNAYLNFERNLLQTKANYALIENLELGYAGGFSTLNRGFVNDSSVIDAAGNYDGAFNKTSAEGSLLENELTIRYKSDNVAIIGGLGHSRQTMNLSTYTFIRSFNFESETNLDSLDLEEKIASAFLHTEWNGTLINEALEPFSLILGSRILNHNQFGTHLTYEINPKVQLTGQTLIYGAITTGFNAPALFQLHSPSQGFGAFTNRGNKSLDPETSISYEIGWKQEIGDNIKFNISLFKTKVDDVIEFIYLWDGSVPVENLGGGDFLGDTYLNISKQNIDGMEAGFSAYITSGLHIAGNISLSKSVISISPDDIDTDYTGGNYVQIFESGKFVTDKHEIDGLTRRPAFSGNLQISYQLVKSLSLGLTSRFTGSRDDIFFSSSLGPFGALDQSEVGGYNVTDVQTRYKLNSNITLGAEIENVFDTNYREINGFTTRGRGFNVTAQITL